MNSIPLSTREIAVIGFPGFQALDIVGPMEVFAVANLCSPPGRKPYRITLASSQAGELVSHAGLRLAGVVALRDLPDDMDTIVVAGGNEQALREAAADHDLLRWLAERAGSARRVASVCVGAFLLASAGLLDGRRATTHWNFSALLQSMFPSVKVEPDAIFIATPPIYTSAGVTAGIDLCLSLVEADCGADVALAVARHLVLFMRRPGGQSQLSAAMQIQRDATPRLRQLLAALIENPIGDLSGAALAERACMSERTFARTFFRETGYTPASFVELARVERARSLLEKSVWPLERVAERSGFSSKDSLQRAFHKRIGVSPESYRERQGGAATGREENHLGVNPP